MGKPAAAVLALTIAAALAATAWLTWTVSGHDFIADNDTNRAACNEVATQADAHDVAERVQHGLGRDYEVIVTQKCSGHLVEIQYASQEDHRRAEQLLSGIGATNRHEGWFFESVPISLRNV